jgi:phage gp36-like protein
MANYTDTATVRQRAGFAGNLNIATTSITGAIATADAIIDSTIFGVYTLPMTETPSLIKEIATHLAVGQLLVDNYGIQDEELKKSGQCHINFATDLLEQIRQRKLKVLSSASTEMSQADANLPSFFPTESSEDDDEPTYPRITINQKY